MKSKRVAVAMSGGVDSSVAAALLLEQGYEVVGFTMQIWPREVAEETPVGGRGCCGLEAVSDARRVARALGIRHYVLNLREAFQRLVIDPFCEEYARGRTPNPCIRCNTYVKFGALLERAREIGASHLATGHYARVGFDEECGRWVLGRAVDKAKDQSYSLYELRQEHLARAWFPLGGLKKSETRARAAKLGLSVANKPDSQEICFVSSGNYGDYLMRVRPETARPGPILDRQGRQLGRHRGIAFYTVGQRHGLRVAGKEALYVVGIDAEHDRLVVGGEEDLKSRELTMREVNYVSLDGLPTGGKKLRAKIRYGAPPASCTAWAEEGGVRLRFARRQRAVAPGQAAVCYEGDKVALGGIIDTAW